MFAMIVKMSLITLLYVGVTFLLWKILKDRDAGVGDKIAIGALYGILSIFSTHFGIDYGPMMLNVRDLGPMTAGLFFSPVSGIIAGIIGGAERYIAGTYFQIGVYTRIACSISTCFAGFFAAFLNVFIFKGKKPSLTYAFVMGSVIEVFHMYVVFVTHRDDMEMAFFVVRTCALPMILFSGVGLALTALVIKAISGEYHNPLIPTAQKDVPVSHRFNVWLFGVILTVLLLNFGFVFAMQTETALQDAKYDLSTISSDIDASVSWIYEHGGNTKNYNHNVWENGSFHVFTESGELIAGSDTVKRFDDNVWKLITANKPYDYFTAEVEAEGIESLCLYIKPGDGLITFIQIPMQEVFYNRDIQAYEIILADILLFTVIYVLISLLLQVMVVDNLLKVNESLGKITEGDLDEKVEVYKSSEFTSLSDDINLTVDVLKGYITAAEKRMEQELLLAHTIQDAALPKNFVFAHDGFELYATMDPAREVGGDFYDFFFVDSDKLALVIADVSGKGIPAALFMMRSKTAIRGLAETGNDLSTIFSRVSSELSQGNDINMFVTVWMGIVDIRTGVVNCINAGHEYPVLMRKGGDFELFKEKHDPPLGIMDGINFHEYDIQLEPGDCIYVYTDGVPDAINTAEEAYGTDRMTEVLNENKSADMETLLHAVKEDIDVHVGKADQFDDITMIGFRYEGK